jgi:hypothetical protein
MKSLFRHDRGNSLENSTITFLTQQLIHPSIYSRSKGRAENKNSHKPEDDAQEGVATAQGGLPPTAR